MTGAGTVLFLARGGVLDGQQQQVLQLASALPASGRPTVVAVDDTGPLLDELRARGIPAECFPMRSWRSPLRFPAAWFDAQNLLRFARRNNASLVHAHDHWRLPYARFVAKRLDIPYVAHIRGPISASHARKYRLAEADAVIAIAARYVDALRAAGVRPERIHLISDSVDLERFSPADLAARHGRAGERQTTVAIVGRIDRFKRVVEFVDLVAALPPALRDNTRFLIVGEEFELGYVGAVKRRIRHHHLGDRFIFTGRVDPQAMPATLAEVDILVTLSGGSVMFEAMAMETAVLSIRDDGQHSRYTIDGETAVCADLGGAAAALAGLIADPQKRLELGRAARALVERELSATRISAQTDCVYRTLLGDERREVSPPIVV